MGSSNSSIGLTKTDSLGLLFPLRVDENKGTIQAINYPNPFSSSTMIEYELTRPDKTILTIFNNLGLQIDRFVNETNQIGTHHFVWNAEDLPSGIYFYTLQVGEQAATGKLVVIR